jgi:2-methylisocitrate lyase-like PEP mutase family enzyme
VNAKCERLRSLIAAREILLLPSIFTGYSARLVARAGFPAAFISGAGLAENGLGWPDVGLMGFEESLRASRALVDCCAPPLIADADTGYRNAVNVFFTAGVRATMDPTSLSEQLTTAHDKRCTSDPTGPRRG